MLELAQLLLYGMIGCFVSSSVFLVDGGVVVLKCGMDVDLCWYRYAIMHSSRLN